MSTAHAQTADQFRGGPTGRADPEELGREKSRTTRLIGRSLARSQDSIHLPPKDVFRDAATYYGTALHELAHLDRD
jgi:hypothetical protein